jgi:hypothetical protein
MQPEARSRVVALAEIGQGLDAGPLFNRVVQPSRLLAIANAAAAATGAAVVSDAGSVMWMEFCARPLTQPASSP